MKCGLHLELLFTVTTDLGDSFLDPDAPVDLEITAWVYCNHHCNHHDHQSCEPSATVLRLTQRGQVQWRSGMRVVKPRLSITGPLQAALEEEEVERASGRSRVEICVSAARIETSADDAGAILTDCQDDGDGGSRGQIMAAWVALSCRGGSTDGLGVLTRKIVLQDGKGQGEGGGGIRGGGQGSSSKRLVVQVQEDIGDSIARHVWDAGVLALCSVAAGQPCLQTPTPSCSDLARLECSGSRHHRQPQGLLFGIMRRLLDSCGSEHNESDSDGGSLNVLELGCGVGILGLGLATMYSALRTLRPATTTTTTTTNTASGLRRMRRSRCTIVLTDVEEAAERARANIALAMTERRRRSNGGDYDSACNDDDDDGLVVRYENLDWEDGRRGRFGAEVAARPWHLIVVSDCTYNVDMLPALVETLGAVDDAAAAASTRKSLVFVATKPRHASERAFFGLMQRARWVVRESQTLRLRVLGERDEAVEMYLFSR